MSDRLKPMIHFVVQHARPDLLGATKLNKVLWFADVMHYRQHGRTISWRTHYTKNTFGPVPPGSLAALAELKRESQIVERSVATPAGPRREFVWLHPADLSVFAQTEIEVLHEVIAWASTITAKEISDLTYDALWEETEMGRPMSVAAASVTPCEPDEEDIAWAEAVFGGEGSPAGPDDALRQAS
ncbi:MAG TPA: Panacea domain-containing protein [Burkholderiaceae bacterium]|nr:Panacea domain-containing protein [Burkholderiaceae bacterium]